MHLKQTLASWQLSSRNIESNDVGPLDACFSGRSLQLQVKSLEENWTETSQHFAL